ncbi:acyltransferase [Pseudoalteromonas sp. 2CM32C]|uniref:acyltransferase family protein n=1 Tax=Pseudoalteromonas sp. 2CM32C TaxID=2929852 RepID=UPI0020BFF4E3|nr:acyltransferase [Pseudoalteromonas sp. 2CM32C]MCK8120635.1 acyltransferase [Pseudoalteromonas sp. 2CM32C]
MMNKRFEALDAFRGICALSVVLYHMNVLGSVTELDFFNNSSIFVEFFFVLSGFVLAHGYGSKENLNFNTFMKARFFRLYPLHFFMFLVFVILEFGKLFAYKFGGFVFNNEPFTNSAAVSEMIPNLLLIHSWTPFTENISFNGPSWSISIEFYMYALLYISIVLFKSNRIISWFAISFTAFLLMYLGSEILVSSVLRGLSCFFGGAFTYVMYKKLSHFKPSYILGSIVETLLLILVVLIVQSTFEYRSIIAPVLFFFTVLFFAFECGIFSQLLKIKPLQYAGKLSYSIYMTHYAILFCLLSTAMVLQKITGIEMAPMIETIRFLNFGGAIINNLVVIVILAIVIYISSLTYKYIEIKGQKLNKKVGADSSTEQTRISATRS